MSKLSVSATLNDLIDGGLRLDATYYASSVYQARKYLDDFEEGGGEVSTVGDFSVGTFNPPPIKRVYTDNRKTGTPYMLPQEMFDFYWEPKKFVLADKMAAISRWYLKKGWVVLTQSGSVGKPYFATKADEPNVLSQNAIRIPPKNVKDGGFIYAYLSTWIGQTLLKKDEFGITVKHIRPQHVNAIPIPNIDAKKRHAISKKVERAFELRAEAIELLKSARASIYEEIGAPDRSPTGDDLDDD